MGQGIFGYKMSKHSLPCTSWGVEKSLSPYLTSSLFFWSFGSARQTMTGPNLCMKIDLEFSQTYFWCVSAALFIHDPAYRLQSPGKLLGSVEEWNGKLEKLGGANTAYWPNQPVEIPQNVRINVIVIWSKFHPTQWGKCYHFRPWLTFVLTWKNMSKSGPKWSQKWQINGPRAAKNSPNG